MVNRLLKFSKFIKGSVHYFIVLAIVMGLTNVYLFGGGNIPKVYLVSVTMFPVKKASLMILFIVVGFIVQIPSMGFYAQHFSRSLVAAAD